MAHAKAGTVSWVVAVLLVLLLAGVIGWGAGFVLAVGLLVAPTHGLLSCYVRGTANGLVVAAAVAAAVALGLLGVG